MKILYVHGAGAQGYGWNWLKDRLPHESIIAKYDCNHSAHDIIDRLAIQIKHEKDVIIVSHSMGGLIGWHLAQRCPNVIGGISIATPWNGTLLADLPCWFGWSFLTQLFSNISRYSYVTQEPRLKPNRVPWLNVICTKGIFDHPKNDGVVEVSSQTALMNDTGEVKYIHCSHNEVLLSDELLGTISDWITRHHN